MTICQALESKPPPVRNLENPDFRISRKSENSGFPDFPEIREIRISGKSGLPDFLEIGAITVPGNNQILK